MAKLLHNYVTRDLGKMKIDKYERASLVRDFLKKNKMTIRDFEEAYHHKRGTVSDWLLWGKITKAHADRFRRRGFSETKLRNMLRGNVEIPDDPIIDDEIGQWLTRIKHYINEPEFTKETINLIQELRDNANRLWMKIENKMNNGN